MPRFPSVRAEIRRAVGKTQISEQNGVHDNAQYPTTGMDLLKGASMHGPDLKTPGAAVDDLRALVGSTPLLEIVYEFDGRESRIFAKYESENMTGSVKDRMALHIIRKSYEQEILRPGDTIVEASSGNTGISFAALGRALGHDVRIYMPNWMSSERVQLIRAFGAEVVPVSHEQGGFVGAVGISSGANVLGAIQLKEQLGSSGTVVTLLPDSNKKYLSTDLCREEPVRENYLTPKVKLKGFRAKRQLRL